jgi:hypothetical protein
MNFMKKFDKNPYFFYFSLMNKANTIKKIALAASILLAAVLAFSCSSDDGEANEPSSSSAELSSSSYSSSSSSIGETTGDSSSSSSGDGQGGGSSSSSGGGGDFSGESVKLTKIYALGNITDNIFEHFETYEDYSCHEGGVIERWIDDYPDSVYYSISNNILVWQEKWWKDTIHFSGISNSLSGTWTRTKNSRENSCEFDMEDNDWVCKSGWSFVKAEFLADTLKVTSDYCMTEEVSANDWQGDWETRIINCSTYEIIKGTEKITVKFGVSIVGTLAYSFAYNDKICYWNQERSFSQAQAACTKAWNKVQAEGGRLYEHYEDILFNSELEECMSENGFPTGWIEE